MNEIEKRVMNVVSDMAVVHEELSLHDSLAGIGIDSLKIVALILSLEDEFGIRISDSDLDPSRLNTIADVAALISKTLSV